MQRCADTDIIKYVNVAYFSHCTVHIFVIISQRQSRNWDTNIAPSQKKKQHLYGHGVRLAYMLGSFVFNLTSMSCSSFRYACFISFTWFSIRSTNIAMSLFCFDWSRTKRVSASSTSAINCFMISSFRASNRSHFSGRRKDIDISNEIVFSGGRTGTTIIVLKAFGNYVRGLLDQTQAELSVARIIRHGHPHGCPYEYPCKWSEGADIHTDILASWPFTWISSWISMRMSVSNYPCYGQFDQGTLIFHVFFCRMLLLICC